MSGEAEAPDLGSAAWFVRRAGLARFTTFACAFGVALSAFIGPRPTAALVGLAGGLLGAVTGTLWGRPRARCARSSGPCPTAKMAAWLLLLSVMSVGMFTGFLVGSLRVAALLDGALQSKVGVTVEAELCVTGQVRSHSGWQSAVAVVRNVQTVASPAGEGPAVRAFTEAVGDTVLLEVPPPRVEGQSRRLQRGAGIDGGGTLGIDRNDPKGGIAEGDPAEVDSSVPLQQGMILRTRGRLEEPDGPTASGYNQARHLLHQGIEVVFRVAGGHGLTVVGYRGGFSGWFDRLRASARSHLALGPSPPVNEVLQGVVMGDTVGIDKEWMNAFRRSGTAHMLSVSGLHVASLAGIMMAFARLIGAARWVGFVLAMGAALLMIPFVGASPPIVRAATMICVILCGRWLGRGRDQWQVLGLAAIVVLAPNPYAVFDVGFQLSFAAFLGLLSLLGPLARLLRRLPEEIGSNAAVSIAASAGTAPVSLAVFDQASLVSPLANLLVVPTLPIVTGLGMASAFFGFVWSGFSVALTTLASLPMMWTVQVSRLMALAPVLGSGDLGRMLFALLAGATMLPIALAVMGRSVRSPPWPPVFTSTRCLAWVRARRPQKQWLAAMLSVVLVVVGVAAGTGLYSPALRGWEAIGGVAAGRSWPASVEVRVLDVGQGNAVLVRTPERRALLFDGGPAECDLGGQLRALGVRRLDLVVISHPHADHFAGLLASLEALQVEALIDGVAIVPPADSVAGAAPPASGSPANAETAIKKKDAGEATDYLRLRRKLDDAGSRYVLASCGYSVVVGGLVVRLFAPDRPLTLVRGPEPWSGRGKEPSGDELNAASLVAVLDIGGVGVLIPGDAEADVLGRYDLPPCDLVVVPHHGSRGAVSDRMLARTRPRVAVISVGEDNPFGHPHNEVMSLLGEAVGTVLRTDQVGWVSCKVNGNTMAISTERTLSR